MTNTIQPVLLMILDGFGISKDPSKSAISLAKKPNIDKLISNYPITTLTACGRSVGLPDGQMGNSEVGHLNIGAGRVVYQDLSKITNDIITGEQVENPALNLAMTNAIKNNKTLHLMGLLSDGGVHSHIDHLFALLNMAIFKGVPKVSIHCFLDGRDVPPDSGYTHMADLEDYIHTVGLGQISTISGRYYAMDRDNRWERVEIAYDALTGSQNSELHYESDSLSTIKNSYDNKIFDEFVIPTVLDNATPVEDGDSVIMFNFRPDRAREITRAFVDTDFAGFERKKVLKDLTYVTMTTYDKTIENVSIAYPKETIDNTLGEWVSAQGLSQLRIAETEKYAHVTFFFNGGIEKPFENEDRILVPSPKVATYDMKPEMSAHEITDKLLAAIEENKHHLIILNFANPDMVGHTGDMDATVAAVEAVDECAGKVVNAILEKGGQVLLTADHGNADLMVDDEGNPVTSHSLNPVPLVNISANALNFEEGGALCDLAPTLLEMLNLPVPKEMTGKSLLKKKIVL